MKTKLKYIVAKIIIGIIGSVAVFSLIISIWFAILFIKLPGSVKLVSQPMENIEGETKIGEIHNRTFLVFSPDGWHYASKETVAFSKTLDKLLLSRFVYVLTYRLSYQNIFSNILSYIYDQTHIDILTFDNQRVIAFNGPWGRYDSVSSIKFSPDSKHFVYHASKEGKNLYIVDNKEEKKYDSSMGFEFSPDSQCYGYQAREGGGVSDGAAFIVLNGQEQKRYEHQKYITFDVDNGPVFSPDSQHMSYRVGEINRRSGKGNMKDKEYIVLDGRERNIFSPIFSSNSLHLAYKLSRDGKEIVVLDEQEGRPYDMIEGLTFSVDSQHLVYGAIEANKVFIIDNDQIKEEINIDDYSDKESNIISHLIRVVFSPDGQDWVYLIKEGYNSPAQNEFFIQDKQKSKKYNILPSAYAFSPDGQHFMYAISKGVYKDTVVLDNQEGKTYQIVDFTTIIFSPNSKHLAYVAKSDKKSFVVLDNQELEKYDGVDNLHFSENGDYLIYNALQDRDVYRVVKKIQ